MSLHVSVLLEECMSQLMIKPEGHYVDATLGLGGHASEIVKRLTTGHLRCFDQDGTAIQHSKERLAEYVERVELIQSNFRHMDEYLVDWAVSGVDGVLFDLGVSSPQLDQASRGFSYQQDAPLDMRMDINSHFTAQILVNTWSKEQLAQIIKAYGEERYAERIAYQIVKAREQAPIETTLELVALIKKAMPAKALREAGHPAMRTFQALRIVVNDELGALQDGLEAALKVLKPGGRIAVISFHSLEDRLVKTTFNRYSKGCTCPPDFPMCVCGFKPTVKVITRQPITAGIIEHEENRRSRSAKLRVAEKI